MGARTTTALRNTLAQSYGSAVTHIALFTADPGTTGAATGEVSGGSYSRKAITWSTAANGQVTASVTIDVPAGVTVRYWGYASGATGANILDSGALAEQTFATAGTLQATLTYSQA